MKYCFMILALGVLLCACANKKDDGYYSYKIDGVMEEEFDLLVAPNMDYESDIAYEQQIKNTKPKTKGAVKLAKPPKQTTEAKK